MNNKRQRNWLFTMLMLVMAWLIPQWTWAQTVSQPTVGDGTADSPYEIATAAELAWFRDHVNEGNYNACAKLTDNIDLSDFCHAADASNNIEELSWEPIGNETHLYQGTFDGNGKTVSNLYINADQSYMGLFGIIIECTVKNLIFENANVTSAASHTGILVGYTGADCSLQNVRTSATCQVKGAEKTGGIAGCFDGDANNCENRATVRGTEEVGGLFGRYSRTGNYMTACANYGTVAATGPFAGGLAGYFSGGTIKDCANYGNVEGSYYIGGMAGFADQGKIQNVFCHGNVTIDEEGGLAFGRSYNGSTEGMVAYYSGATLTIKGQKQEARAFGTGNLAEDKAKGYDENLLKSGIVAYMLQQAASADASWGQNLGDGQNAYPVLGSTDLVYLDGNVTLSCTGTLEGTLTNAKPETEGTLKKEHTGSKTHREAVAATCTQDGSIEYWTCSACNRLFSDEQLANEISSTTILATGHNYDTADRCTNCSQEIPSLTLGNNKVNIDKVTGTHRQITGYNLYKLTATEDGTLEVTASSGKDTYGTLWGSRADSDPLTSDDSGNGNDFKLTYTVSSGTTYYIGARDYNGNAIDGDVTLYVTLNGRDMPEGVSGLGTAESPFVLSTAEHLAWFRDKVNGGENSVCAKISDDVEVIDMNSGCHAADASNNIEELSWKPIGNETHSYRGTFDGNGKTVSNLYINAGQSYMGLFGIIIGCTVKNLIFENANVTSTAYYTGILVGFTGADCSLQDIRTSATCQVKGAENTGGIAGCLDGDANNCENRATVRGTKNVGGLFGSYSRTGNSMTACANYGTVTATGSSVGGLAGYFSSGTIKDCANYGNVEGSHYIGGMAGFANQGKIQNVFCHGNVTANIDEDGGLAFGFSYNGSTEGMVAYYSGATLTIKGQKQEARAFGTGNLAEDKAKGYDENLLKSGVVAYMLQQAASADASWGQNLGDGQNAYPVLGSTDQVYLDGNATLSCTGTLEGTLTNAKPETEGTLKKEHTGSKTHREAVAATCTQDGSIEYWTCSACNRLFSDEQLANEISSTTILATGHNYDTADRCTNCLQEMPSLTLGNNKVNIDKVPGTREQITGYNLYKLTATEDGTLEVTASSGKDTYGTLWESKTASSPLYSNYHGNGADFKITYTVSSGTTYYIGARDYNGNAIDGDVTLYVTLNGRDVELPEGVSGSGTAVSPFVLSTAEHLAWFRDQVNGGKGSICAKISDDVEVIDMNSVCHAADASNNIEELSWEPIGNETHKYWGTFDGNGKTVSNLYINADQRYMGLFGFIIECTVKNLIFENANVTSTAYYTGILAGSASPYCSLQDIRTSATCQVNGAEKTGGIAGSLDGDANNCENRATIRGKEEVGGLFGSYSRTGNSITACANYGAVTATGSSVGGLAGYFNSGTIKDCANYGNVEGSNYIGGMAGFADQGKIQNVFCHGNVTANINGGLAFGHSSNGSTEGMVAYYSGATLTIEGQKQEARAFGTGNLAEDNAAGYTKEQIASGEMAWLLNGSASAPAEGETLYWYQKLGDNADAYPVLVSTGANTVYKAPLTSCDGATSIGEYANNPEGDKLSHHYQMAETPAEGTTNLYGEICSVCQYANDEAKYIKDFCGIEGNDIKLTVESDGSYTAAEPVDINDATTYDSPVDFTAPTLNYTRSYLGAEQWQAVYVPFEADATDWTDNGITVASINNFHEYEKEDGSGYETVLEVKKATSGEFEANTPYVVRTSGSGSESKTITISEAKLHKAASETYYCMSMTRRYDFTGIYTPQSGLGRDDISAVYALDKQGRMAPLRPATTLGAQRWYLTVSNRNGSSLPQESVARTIRIDMIGEGETTGIKDIQVITGNGTAHTGIYDLQGRKLNNEPTHGIYIKNGKKHVK